MFLLKQFFCGPTKIFKMNFLCFLAVIITVAESLQDDWVDPHEMKINVRKQLKRSSSESDKDVPAEYIINSAPSMEDNMPLVYLKRTINLILQFAEKEIDNPNVYKGVYKYSLDSEEYKFLVQFARNENTNNEDIRKLDTVLSKIFSNSYQSTILNFIGDVKSHFLNFYLYVMGGIIFLIAIYTFIKNKSGFGTIFSYIITVLLIWDYGYCYRAMYEEAEEHNMKLSYTAACDTDKMGWNEYFKFLISEKDCEKRIVSPLKVCLYQVKHIIIIPLESFGTGMGKFGKELWENLPFPWNIIIFPSLLIFIGIIIFIFMLAMKNKSFTLKLFHLLQFEFGKGRDEENRISGRTLEKLLEAATHTRIEDTRSSPKKNKPKKIKNKNKSLNNEETNTNKNNCPLKIENNANINETKPSNNKIESDESKTTIDDNKNST